jgi:methyltransferase (TIGR00027 family)
MTSIHSGPTFAKTWQQDYQDRVNPELMTSLLHQAVPVLRYSDWKILHVEEGLCQSILPLNEATTNQHGTHQAALISLSADYTGGMALATLLRDTPLTGIHRCDTERAASLWLAAMSVKFRAPSSGHLIGTCRVTQDKVQEIQRRYFRGDRVLATLPVEFRSNGDLVANAEMKYFAQPSARLLPTARKPVRSALFSHTLKASARMIAGVRAQTSRCQVSRLEPSHDSAAAGPHGQLLAARLQTVLPQLTDMVHARTRHCDDTIRSVPDLAQVVILGVGLDLRPIRLSAELPFVRFIELDLPEMIEERQRVIAEIAAGTPVRRTLVPIDFKTDDISSILLNQAGYDPGLPTVFVYEGCSMYFCEDENNRLYSAVRRLMRHPASRFWLDVVDTSIVERRRNNPAVAAFLDGMQELGESFIYGLDTPETCLTQLGFHNISLTRCGDILNDHDNVFDSYRFVVAEAGE